MPLLRHQILSSLSLAGTGVVVLLITFQTAHGQVVADTNSVQSAPNQRSEIAAWMDQELPVSPIYLAKRGVEKVTLVNEDGQTRADTCVHRVTDRIETAQYSWDHGYHDEALTTLHKGLTYLSEAATGWDSPDRGPIIRAADQLQQSFDRLEQSSPTDEQRMDLDRLREQLQALREQRHI